MAGGGDSSALLSIPTWAIAVTCAIFILVSLVIERVIHCIGNCAGRYNHAAFLHAFEKMKDELLMVGILSLALATGQDAFTKACVRASWYKHARLCDDYGKDATKAVHVSIHSQQRRHLAAAADATSTCKAVGRWKAWEARVADKEKLIKGGGARITVQTTFVRRRATSKWLKNPIVAGVAAFFKQFFRTVTESDYVTLRGGFIKPWTLGLCDHLATSQCEWLGNKFACQLGASDCTKMQLILTEMANEIQEQNAIILVFELGIESLHPCRWAYLITFVRRRAASKWLKNPIVAGGCFFQAIFQDSY